MARRSAHIYTNSKGHFREIGSIPGLKFPDDNKVEKNILKGMRDILPLGNIEELTGRERGLLRVRKLHEIDAVGRSKIGFNIHVSCSAIGQEKHCRIRVTNLSATIQRGRFLKRRFYLLFQDRVGVSIENNADLVVREKFPFPEPRSVEHEHSKVKESTKSVGLEVGGGMGGAQASGKMDYQVVNGSSHTSRFQVGDFEILPDEVDGWECFLMHLQPPKGGREHYSRQSNKAVTEALIKKRWLFRNQMRIPVQQSIGTFAWKEFIITHVAPDDYNENPLFSVKVYQQARYITSRKGFMTIENSIEVPVNVDFNTFEIQIGEAEQKIRKWVGLRGRELQEAVNPEAAPE